MNIINYARAIPYGMREQAIERLSFGLANEPKWGRKQKSQVALLLTYFKQGYYNDNIEFLEQMIKDWDIITSKDFVIFSDQAQEDFNEHPYSYWAKKLDHVIHIPNKRSTQTGGGVHCDKYGALLGNNYAPTFMEKPICLKCLLKAFEG